MQAPGIPHDPAPAPLSTEGYVLSFVIPAALALLPARLDSFEARVMLLAIGMQESRFSARHQVGGPARGFWEFEAGGGVADLLHHDHPATLAMLYPVLDLLQYEPADCFDAIQHNDVLACVLARLLLWTHPAPIPEDERNAWAYYLATWRPGRPRPETWTAYFQKAVAMVAA
jgi:hypothetical protein